MLPTLITVAISAMAGALSACWHPPRAKWRWARMGGFSDMRSSSKTLTTAFLLCVRVLSAHGNELWSFDQVISFAVTNNPDARIAAHRIAMAEATLKQAQAAFLPVFQIQSGYTQSDNPMQVFGSALNQRSFSPSLDFNDVPDADNLNLRGVLTLPLYTGGKLSSGREAAASLRQAERHNAAAVRNELEFAAARAFHIIVKSREMVGAATAEARTLESSLHVASNRFNAGALLKTELLDLEVRLAQSRENLVRATNTVVLANRVLNNLLGLEVGEISIDPHSHPAFQSSEEPGSARRPELASLEQQKRAAEAQVRIAKSDFRPRVNAFGSMDYDHGWRFNGSGESYTAGITVQWNVFDGNLTRAKVAKAEAELASVREQSRKARLAIDFEIDSARLSLNEANERLAVTEKTVAVASESAQLTRHRFSQGLALASQLMDAESALTRVRVRRAEAEADYRIAAAALRKALGQTQLPEAFQ